MTREQSSGTGREAGEMSEDRDDADDLSAALAKVARLNEEAASLAAAADPHGPGTTLVPAAGPGPPAEQVKASLIALRARAEAAARDLAAAQQRARDLIRAQQQALEDQLASYSDALAPLRRQAALLEDGITAINLYMGAGEEFVQLTEGEPAAPGPGTAPSRPPGTGSVTT
jgi:hypothetical protein